MHLQHGIAGTIKQVRTEQNKRIRDLGIHVSMGHLSEIERGIKTPSIEMLQEISRGLHLTTPEFLREIANYMEEN